MFLLLEATELEQELLDFSTDQLLLLCLATTSTAFAMMVRETSLLLMLETIEFGTSTSTINRVCFHH